MEKDEVFCPECGKSFPGERLLAWHRDAVHRQAVEPLGGGHVETAENQSDTRRAYGPQDGPSGDRQEKPTPFLKRELKPSYMDPWLMMFLGVGLIGGGTALSIWGFNADHWGFSLIGVNGLWTGWVLLRRGWGAVFG